MKRLWMLNRAISTRSLLHIPGKYFGGMHKLFPIARNFSLRFFDLCVLKHGVHLFSFCNAVNFSKTVYCYRYSGHIQSCSGKPP